MHEDNVQLVRHYSCPNKHYTGIQYLTVPNMSLQSNFVIKHRFTSQHSFTNTRRVSDVAM